MNTTQKRGTNAIVAILVGILGAALSLGRILLANPEALSTLLWAEDGLFPLCVLKEDVLTCTADPFAGYLLLGPRLIAGLVALFPMEQWPLITHLAAAGTAGLAVAIAYASLRTGGRTWATALLGSLIVVLAPIVGLEAINAVGSIYMPLVFAAAVALAYPPRSRGGGVWLGILLAVTILTIPSAIVLAVPVVVMGLRRILPGTTALIFLVILVLGLGIQWWVGNMAETPRNLSVTAQGLVDWVTALPLAVVSFWPGLFFGEATTFGIFVIPPFWPTGLIIIVAVLALGLWNVVRGSAAIGSLLLVGFGLGAIPTLTGYANNRYFVLPVILWALALLIAVDQKWGARRTWLMPLILVVSIVVWLPAFGASPWRVGASPKWTDEIARIQAVCADPAASVDMKFSPDWPMEITVLDPPTQANALCVELADRL